MPADRVGTDRALANGGARGTGAYRPPALIRVANAAPYFHHGAVATLEELLSPERFQPNYTKGFLGPGPVTVTRMGRACPKWTGMPSWRTYARCKSQTSGPGMGTGRLR